MICTPASGNDVGNQNDTCVTTYDPCPVTTSTACKDVSTQTTNTCGLGETGAGRVYQATGNTCSPGVWSAWTLVTDGCTPVAQNGVTVDFHGTGCVLPADGSGCNISSYWSVGGLPAGETVDLNVAGPGALAKIYKKLPLHISEIIIKARSLVATLTSGLPVNRSASSPFNQPVVTAGTYRLGLQQTSTGAPLGSVLALVACPTGYTIGIVNGVEKCIAPSSTSNTCTPTCGGGTSCFNGSCVASCPAGYTANTSGTCVVQVAQSCPNQGKLCDTSEANSCGMHNYSHIQCSNGVGVCPAVLSPDESLCKAPDTSLKISPSLIVKGGQCTLDWSVGTVVSKVTTCSLSGAGVSDGCDEVNSPGSCTSHGSGHLTTPNLDQSAQYKLTCQSGPVSSRITRTVNCTVNPVIFEPSN
jgi:hypothetical protein